MADHEGAIAAIVPGFTGMSLNTRFGSAWKRFEHRPHGTLARPQPQCCRVLG